MSKWKNGGKQKKKYLMENITPVGQKIDLKLRKWVCLFVPEQK